MKVIIEHGMAVKTEQTLLLLCQVTKALSLTPFLSHGQPTSRYFMFLSKFVNMRKVRNLQYTKNIFPHFEFY